MDLTAEDVTLASRIRITEDVVFHDLQGEVVILNLKRGVYFGLDPVGTRMWHLLQEQRPLQKILEILVGEYDVTEGKCKDDLLGFVASLRAHGLVEVDREPPP